MGLTIAIDGPVGAGKSTIAKGLADALNILHLDTGATYRALALGVLRAGISPADRAGVEAYCAGAHVSVRLDGRTQRTLLNGEDVTDQLRTPEISAAASAISVYPAVRGRMVALQRRIAEDADIVLDGRDIGTRVLPDARFKFYLDAPEAVRAQRRYLELSQKGFTKDLETVRRELSERDAQDAGRAVDPLRQAEDAIRIDTGTMTQDEVVALLVSIIHSNSRPHKEEPFG